MLSPALPLAKLGSHQGEECVFLPNPKYEKTEEPDHYTRGPQYLLPVAWR